MNFSHVIYFTSVSSGQLLAVRHTMNSDRKLIKRKKNNFQECQFEYSDFKLFRTIKGWEDGEGKLMRQWDFLTSCMLP